MAATGACPGCGEALEVGTPRCFRCEAALSAWWELEALLRAAGEEPRSPLGRGAGVRAAATAAYAAGLVLAVIVGMAVGRGSAPAPLPPPVAARVVVPSVPAPVLPPAPAVVSYTVQRGDSPWRIAAALLGDGRRWPELATPRGLRPGQRLEVTCRAAAGASR